MCGCFWRLPWSHAAAWSSPKPIRHQILPLVTKKPAALHHPFTSEPPVFCAVLTKGQENSAGLICQKQALFFHAAAVKSLQSCPTLCDPMNCSLPGFSVPGILQARTLEWVAISFSNAWKWKVKVKSLSCVLLLATPWTAAYQAPPSMGFSGQQYWSGVPLPSPRYILPYIK